MTRPSSKVRNSLVRAGITVVASMLCLAVMTSAVWADCASGRRAILDKSGHVTTCKQVGFAYDTIIGSSGQNSASDADISGTVITDAGSNRPGGRREEVNIAVSGASLIVDAVVVAGGNGYNKYTDETYLPPTLRPHQHYVPPLTNSRTVPKISHWFVCYHPCPQAALPESPSAIALPVVGGTVFAAGWYRRRRRRGGTTLKS